MSSNKTQKSDNKTKTEMCQGKTSLINKAQSDYLTTQHANM